MDSALKEFETVLCKRKGSGKCRVEHESTDLSVMPDLGEVNTHRKPKVRLKKTRKPRIVTSSERSCSAARLARDCGAIERMGTSSFVEVSAVVHL